jgi:hypothetical protein
LNEQLGFQQTTKKIMTAEIIDIHNHGYSKRFFDAVRRGDGERYGLRIAATAKGEALVKPDGGSHPLQPKRAEYDKNLAQLGTAGIDGRRAVDAALCEFRRLR